MGALALSRADLRDIDGEPRVHDVRLADVLGFGRARRVRDIISRHQAELLSHGFLPQIAAKINPGRGRPERHFLLNEAQAVLVTMFSRTEQAEAARTQIIKVFLAYRHGQLGEPQSVFERRMADPWEAQSRRLDQLEKLMNMVIRQQSPEFTRAAAYAPSILRLRDGEGRRLRNRRPLWWHDLPVRSAVLEHHRQMTIDQARNLILRQFGSERCPSRSSIGRAWRQFDEMRAVH